MPVSGENTTPPATTPASPAEAPASPAEAPAPRQSEGDTIALSKRQHDQLFGENRTLKEKLRKVEEAEAKRERDKLAAEGRYEDAVRVADEAREAAELRATNLAREAAVRDAALRRGWTPDQVTAAVDLAALDSVQLGEDGRAVDATVETALDALAGKYASIFTTPAPGGDAGARPSEPAPTPGPTNPPAAGAPFSGYVSPEEYVRTPQNIRMSADFQKRVHLSKPHWPQKVRSDTFAQSTD
jgi:hypothetical protein